MKRANPPKKTANLNEKLNKKDIVLCFDAKILINMKLNKNARQNLLICKRMSFQNMN